MSDVQIQDVKRQTFAASQRLQSFAIGRVPAGAVAHGGENCISTTSQSLGGSSPETRARPGDQNDSAHRFLPTATEYQKQTSARGSSEPLREAEFDSKKRSVVDEEFG